MLFVGVNSIGVVSLVSDLKRHYVTFVLRHAPFQSVTCNLQTLHNNDNNMAQSALQNVPHVVMRPAWENTVACSYLPKVHTGS